MIDGTPSQEIPVDDAAFVATDTSGLTAPVGITVPDKLQELVLDSVDVGDFLVELSQYSAQLAAPQSSRIFECAVTLQWRRRSRTGAGSTPRARLLNDIQERIGEGPCLEALEQQRTVNVQDTMADTRWSRYNQVLVEEGIRSVLAVPLELELGAAASLNFFSETPQAFSDMIIDSAEQYARHAQRALRLAVRIAQSQQLADDLHEAMKSRTAIDLAVGVIMGQQRCSQKTAFGILSKAASSRNKKLREVAYDMLANMPGNEVTTHFDR